MNVKLPLALRNASLQLLINAFDAHTNPAYIEFYTAPQPLAAGDAITTQTLLGTWTLSKPSGTVANGVMTFAIITGDAAADDTGTIAWARIYDGSGAFVMDGDCGLLASDALIRFNTLAVLAGGLIDPLGGFLTAGGG
ncbi:MAG: hypothetical protein Q7U98_17290 [Methylicorpusculum sp.]|uniref:hypothetical protein n=1 Tax=Methylicorpusculum sp. TaxID=2713644 RepID=UPI0027268C69|nr:hypothetical protein [Methylicorpusculum sp.]MDO8940912.1 hypothetical protein [Methylicorpusculum sp.]MDP2202397.1 hypothetical protein [Methylicorpusculum sp.]